MYKCTPTSVLYKYDNGAVVNSHKDLGNLIIYMNNNTATNKNNIVKYYLFLPIVYSNSTFIYIIVLYKIY